MLAGDVEVVTKHFDRTDSPTEFNAKRAAETEPERLRRIPGHRATRRQNTPLFALRRSWR